jgi:hypothetical protein
MFPWGGGELIYNILLSLAHTMLKCISKKSNDSSQLRRKLQHDHLKSLFLFMSGPASGIHSTKGYGAATGTRRSELARSISRQHVLRIQLKGRVNP